MDDIQRIVSVSVNHLPGEGKIPDNFVIRSLNREHPNLGIEASLEDQCATHLAASIVTALRPFLG